MQRVNECLSALKVTNADKRIWKISEFSKLKDVWTSEEFTAGSYRWKVKLYPNGDGSREGRSVSIYVECVHSKSFAPHQKVKAHIRFRFKNQLRDDAHRCSHFSYWFKSKCKPCGFPNFIPIVEMRDRSKGFVVDNCCCLETEISVPAVVGDAPKSV